ALYSPISISGSSGLLRRRQSRPGCCRNTRRGSSPKSATGSASQTKLVLLVLFLLGGIATSVGSEAVLPAYIIGMVLAPAFQHDHELAHRMRVMAFAILTPFYFLKAGSLIEFNALVAGAGLIALFLGLKMLTQFVGILPLTRLFRFKHLAG